MRSPTSTSSRRAASSPRARWLESGKWSRRNGWHVDATCFKRSRRDRIEKLRRRLGEVGTTEDPPLKAAAIEAAEYQVGRRAQTLATAIEHAGGLYLPDRLHAVRVAAKKLRYALEIERELKALRGTARIAQLKRLQDLLGRMHDFEMLIDRTRQLQADVAGSDRRLAFELDRLIRTLEQECRQLHAVYMRRRASILKLASQVSSATTPRPSAVA